MKDLKIGDKLYAYNIAYGWTKRFNSYEFVITRETKTMWVLSLGGKEYQKIKKDTLEVFGNGIDVHIQRDEEKEKLIKDFKDCKYLAYKIDDLQKRLQSATSIPSDLLGLFDYFKSVDETKQKEKR